ncbi:cytochrome P450 CYP749A22-like [Impatiens glandulifera]|uniref:cytochrome P450 CYP749A22-like n=1 Tax=Impatiens glandulifera TaxID=253017 RepID=UPI001FB0F1D2|nr:cytochrome P450 CYP749A22-like [Impatiens glandulifera]
MNFLNWHGPQAQLFVSEPELIKEILNNREGAYPKMKSEGFAKKLMGQSMITNEGEKWAKIRKLANHTFHAESLKGMVPEMILSVDAMLENWKKFDGKDVDVYKEFGLLTTEVISRTAFGSCFMEGKHIFEMVAKLTSITVKNVYNVRFPLISKIVKTADELEAGKLERNIKSSVLELVKKREADMVGKSSFGDDYLGQLINVYHDPSNGIMIDQMIDEIRTIYGAGHLTTTNLLAWTIFLLSINIDWQEKARNEVIELFGHEKPSSDGIARLRNVSPLIIKITNSI